LQHLTVRSKGKIRRVKYAATFLPVGADFVSILRNLEAITDGKSRAGALDHFLGFVEGIDGERDDVGILRLEFFKMGLIVGDLPNAVRSPDAAVKDDHRVFARKIAWQV